MKAFANEGAIPRPRASVGRDDHVPG